MVTRIDEKGKVFTERVRKEALRATVHTTTHTFVGAVHIQPDARLRDDLNYHSERFIAITDAEVYVFVGDRQCRIQSAPFLVINKDHIVAVVPMEQESKVEGGQPE